jgi:hypothetical protein
MIGRNSRRHAAGWRRSGGGSAEAELSPTALSCLDRQLSEALDLAVSCRALSDCSQAVGDLLTAVALERLSNELSDQAAMLAPLVRPGILATVPPFLDPPPADLDTCLAQLDHRLSQAALVGESDAMSPDLEATVGALLWSLAALYRTHRELVLVCTLLGSA